VKKRILRWLLVLTWGVAGLYFADRGATYYQQARTLPSSVLDTIPEMAPHRVDDRVLIFAPHPDDEVLGCAGVIQQALQAGAQVWVVYLTNGDGFRLAVERQFRQAKPTPEQYVQFGEMRQQEARRGMELLGLAPWRITFLGYPDRGLYDLWQSNWSAANALRSYYTDTDTNPYRDSLRPGSLYCGQNVLRDVETILRRTVPTHVYVTHPADEHPDHSAAALFVQTALAHLRLQGIGFAQKVVLRQYMVHCRDWPQPQGLHLDQWLVPPSPFYGVGLHWKQLRLTPQWQTRKLQAIRAHRSQMLMMARFLHSFVRHNELFIEQSVVSDVHPTWGFVWQEATEGDFLREVQAPGDFSAAELRRNGRQITLHLHTRGKPRTGYTYIGSFHVLQPNGKITTFTLKAKPGKHSPNARVGEDGVSFLLPATVQGSLLTVQAQSRFAGLPVDKTLAQVVRVP